MADKGLDLPSFGAGLAVGRRNSVKSPQQLELERIQRKGDHEQALRDIDSKSQLATTLVTLKTENLQLDGEIKNRWIPYAVRLRASLIAGKAQRSDLIAILRELNPENAEYLIEESKKRAAEKYDELYEKEHYKEVKDLVKKESLE